MKRSLQLEQLEFFSTPKKRVRITKGVAIEVAFESESIGIFSAIPLEILGLIFLQADSYVNFPTFAILSTASKSIRSLCIHEASKPKIDEHPILRPLAEIIQLPEFEVNYKSWRNNDNFTAYLRKREVDILMSGECSRRFPSLRDASSIALSFGDAAAFQILQGTCSNAINLELLLKLASILGKTSLLEKYWESMNYSVEKERLKEELLVLAYAAGNLVSLEWLHFRFFRQNLSLLKVAEQIGYSGDLQCFDLMISRCRGEGRSQALSQSLGLRILHVACEFGHASMVNKIINEGSRVRPDDKCLSLASLSNNLEVVDTLIRARAPWHECSILYPVLSENWRMVSHLLFNGFPISEKHVSFIIEKTSAPLEIFNILFDGRTIIKRSSIERYVELRTHLDQNYIDLVVTKQMISKKRLLGRCLEKRAYRIFPKYRTALSENFKVEELLKMFISYKPLNANEIEVIKESHLVDLQLLTDLRKEPI